MPHALYDCLIDVRDRVYLRDDSPYCFRVDPTQVGIVEEVILNVTGHWDVQVKFGAERIVVGCMDLNASFEGVVSP